LTRLPIVVVACVVGYWRSTTAAGPGCWACGSGSGYAIDADANGTVSWQWKGGKILGKISVHASV